MWYLLGYKMNKRVGGLKEFQFEPLTSGRSLSVTIAVTGWLSETHQGTGSSLSYRFHRCNVKVFTPGSCHRKFYFTGCKFFKEQLDYKVSEQNIHLKMLFVAVLLYVISLRLFKGKHQNLF